MNTVVLTVGLQGVGKTIFCKKIIQAHPSIGYVNRDQIFLDHFCQGAHDMELHDLDSRHAAILERVLQEISNSTSTCIILDFWNITARDRQHILNRLRRLGIHRVGIWRFTIPEETRVSWLNKRQQTIITSSCRRSLKYLFSGPSEETLRLAKLSVQHHQSLIFNQATQNIEKEEGFDFFVNINPLTPPDFESLLP